MMTRRDLIKAAFACCAVSMVPFFPPGESVAVNDAMVIVDLRELARAQLARWHGERIDDLTIKVLTGRSWMI